MKCIRVYEKFVGISVLRAVIGVPDSEARGPWAKKEIFVHNIKRINSNGIYADEYYALPENAVYNLVP